MKIPTVFIMTAAVTAIIIMHNSYHIHNTELKGEEEIELMEKRVIKETYNDEVTDLIPSIKTGRFIFKNASSYSYLSSNFDSVSMDSNSVWNIVQSDASKNTVNFFQSNRCLQVGDKKSVKMSEPYHQISDGDDWLITYDKRLKAYTIHAEMKGVKYYLSNAYNLKRNLTYKTNEPISKMYWYIYPYTEDVSESEEVSDGVQNEIIEVYDDSDSYDEI